MGGWVGASLTLSSDDHLELISRPNFCNDTSNCPTNAIHLDHSVVYAHCENMAISVLSYSHNLRAHATTR